MLSSHVCNTWETKRTRGRRNRRRNPRVSHINLSQPNLPEARTIRSTIFVSNLPYTATSTDLQTLFSDIAPVRSAFVVLEQGTGVSKGVGYVSFAIKEDAQSAFESISSDGINLNGRKLRVQWADVKVSNSSAPPSRILLFTILAERRRDCKTRAKG